METIRCGNCRKKLAEAEFIRLSIKCPRCGVINQLKAVEPLISMPRASENEVLYDKSNHPLDRR
ncbi:Com family DNA-binding transcriptional regulator [Methylobacter tundripaludum]|uniref:Com family DNA-binding transcriptional regulator n=1 Tax=Methylobacter tundripaludum TaxID=173365 RepID=UPI0009DD640C